MKKPKDSYNKNNSFNEKEILAIKPENSKNQIFAIFLLDLVKKLNSGLNIFTSILFFNIINDFNLSYRLG